MRPVVSVVMPFLNEEAYIAEAIESVRLQTLSDWELILVDDGSSDRSPAIAAKYASDDPKRIRVLRRDGAINGAAAARNLGVAQAKGEFAAFLDADDLYDGEKLATEIGILQTYPEAAMVYGPVRWWYPGAESRDFVERLGIATERIYPPPQLATEVLLKRKGNIPCTCGVLVRRSNLLATGGCEVAFSLYEDQTLWAKLFLRYPTFVSSCPLARYRQHSASTTARAIRSGEYHPFWRHAAQHRFLEWLRSYIDTNHITEPELADALEKALSPYYRRSAAARHFVVSLCKWLGFKLARNSVIPGSWLGRIAWL